VEHAEIIWIDEFRLRTVRARAGMMIVLTRVSLSQRTATVWALGLVIVFGRILKN
jgi:hypothetical protein